MQRFSLVAAALIALVAVAGCGTGTASLPPAQSQAPASASAAASAAAGCADAPAGATAAVTISIANFAFQPASAAASVGDVVEWMNNDTQAHSAAPTGCSTDDLDPGAKGALVFNVAGTYDYVCGIHPEMTATLTVQ